MVTLTCVLLCPVLSSTYGSLFLTVKKQKKKMLSLVYSGQDYEINTYIKLNQFEI